MGEVYPTPGHYGEGTGSARGNPITGTPSTSFRVKSQYHGSHSVIYSHNDNPETRKGQPP